LSTQKSKKVNVPNCLPLEPHLHQHKNNALQPLHPSFNGSIRKASKTAIQTTSA
jgi:hypothetical protein